MKQYIVLKAISPDQGPVIFPAVPTEDNPTPAPVLVGDEIFDPPNEYTTEQRAAILIGLGVLAPVPEEPAKAAKAAKEK